MKVAEINRPLRVLDKVLAGGLGAGNIGVVMARHGHGKVAILTSIAIDHAMDSRNTLHISVGKSVSQIRAFHDEVLEEILVSLDHHDNGQLLTDVERHKQIYAVPDADHFSINKCKEILAFLGTHAQFVPEMVEISGWPDFENISAEEFSQLATIAKDNNCEVWLTAHTHLNDECDRQGIPNFISRHLDSIEVLIALEPESDHVNLNFVKTHGKSDDSGIHLEFDPNTMLIRWR